MPKTPWWSVVQGVGGAVLVAWTIVLVVAGTVAQPKIKELAVKAAEETIQEKVPRLDTAIVALQKKMDRNELAHEKITDEVTSVRQDVQDLQKMQLITMTPEQRKEYSRYLMGRRP